MTYSEVTSWLFKQIPNFHQTGALAYKPGLTRMKQLMEALGNPHKGLKTIHIAGTNGKGSVAHILAAIFQNHGYRTGIFTSPHIHDFRERIKINGELISEKTVVDFVTQNKVNFSAIDASFFEITTALAFDCFAKENCDITIIETGLGGRLDATNIIEKPEVAIITTIGRDHEQFLGNTLASIATEKAGIIKAEAPVVLGQIDDELISIFHNKAAEVYTQIILTNNEDLTPIPTDLLADYQQGNIRTALTATRVLKENWNLDFEKIKEAVQNIGALTHFHGRFQQLGTNPLIIADAGHNEIGIRSLLNSIAKYPMNSLRIIYGASNDKDWKSILNLFPKEAILYLTEFKAQRSVKAKEWQAGAAELPIIFNCFEDANQALRQCKLDAQPDDIILICGSFYLLEELI